MEDYIQLTYQETIGGGQWREEKKKELVLKKEAWDQAMKDHDLENLDD